MYKKHRIILLVVAIAGLTGAFTSGIYVGKLGHLPFVVRGEFSIGIYTGQSPLGFSPPQDIKNPVLTAEDVKDSPAQYVADPFMVEEHGTWYMFFEVMNAQTHQGDIGLATSKDGRTWKYKQIVLDEPFHLSYPYVFKWKQEYYMIPEAAKSFQLRLYKATDFPTKWSFIKTLLKGVYKDPSIFYFESRWWLFVEEEDGFLHLYYADEVTGPWTEHPESPIVKGDRSKSRPGGRVLISGDRIIRYAQNDLPYYGRQVRAFIVTKLTLASYQEVEDAASPILNASGSGWNRDGMHQIDPHLIDKSQWIACVDGYRNRLLFGIKYR